MKFVQRFNSFIHTIAVMIDTPAPARVSAHCTNIDVLLMHLCDFDRERYTYILRWLAYPLRNPGAKMRYGLIVKGEPRTGIKTFFQHVAIALHQGAGRIVHPGALNATLNHSWAGAPLVVVNGSVPRHAMAHVKALITSDTVIVERKHEPARWVPNRMNFVFLTGNRDAIPAAPDNRRFMVLEAPPAREEAFYRAIEREIEDGGIDAFRHFLLHVVPMGSFNETTVPPGVERAPYASGRPLSPSIEGHAA
jgi:putative DNA primase/helicase